MRNSRLREHLLRGHGRTGREIDGLPLADLHRWEHVEASMDLIVLHHRHPAEGSSHRPRPPAAPG